MAANHSRFLLSSILVARSLTAGALALGLLACHGDDASPGPAAGSAGQGAAGQGAAGQGAAGQGAAGQGAAGAGGSVLIYSYAAPACGDCLAQRCASEMDECRTSTSCLAITGCLSQCESSTVECRVSCDNTPWRPDERAAGVRACQVAACAEPCGITCGGMLARTADCAGCGSQHCCDEAAACAASQDCMRLDACVLQCEPGSPCETDCRQRFPAGQAPREAWRGCLSAACGEHCGQGLVAPPP